MTYLPLFPILGNSSKLRASARPSLQVERLVLGLDDDFVSHCNVLQSVSEDHRSMSEFYLWPIFLLVLFLVVNRLVIRLGRLLNLLLRSFTFILLKTCLSMLRSRFPHFLFRLGLKVGGARGDVCPQVLWVRSTITLAGSMILNIFLLRCQIRSAYA